MAQVYDAWAEHARRRWMRSDAPLWIRPDAYRFMPPGAPRLTGKDVVRYFWPDAQIDQPSRPDGHDDAAVLRTEREHLLRLKSELILLRAEIKFQRLLRALKAYNPNQPRVPAGNSDGGQWTSGNSNVSTLPILSIVGDEARDDAVELAQFGDLLTDVDGYPYYRPGGHHEMPEAVYKEWKLDPETRSIFRQSSTGTIGATLRITPDSALQGNIWGGLHKAYNDAVQELSERFFKSNGIRLDASDMKPDQARSLLKQIRESEDTRIRDFNVNVRRIQRLRRLRGGDD